jgi:hypothetical protein
MHTFFCNTLAQTGKPGFPAGWHFKTLPNGPLFTFARKNNKLLPTETKKNRILNSFIPFDFSIDLKHVLKRLVFDTFIQPVIEFISAHVRYDYISAIGIHSHLLFPFLIRLLQQKNINYLSKKNYIL